MKRDNVQEGVVVWLTIDVTNCEKDCFSNVGTVVSFLGRAAAKKVSLVLVISSGRQVIFLSDSIVS